ncbi:hypothetical protein IEQ34_001481 [Dendrobium chrysotoxum]|uniref:Uncharacterized protein n=1 Tax=Dendrobium chrysotoxum TaxID=161865 RepID=A0AAV7HQX3_DENCH|nr:hypothetical protein IEQ34_001481 [Dendrobium chrysotoxum]
MGTREVYEEKLRSGNLYRDPTINPGLGNARCPRCLSLLFFYTQEWGRQYEIFSFTPHKIYSLKLSSKLAQTRLNLVKC